jgi:antitoxin component HigA of HigAB toxin-antitoxin module
MKATTVKTENSQDFTPSQYYAAMSEIENYISRGFENLSKKEAMHLDQLSDKVHEYESVKYPMPMPDSVSGILRGYMIDKKLNRATLGSLLKVSGATISDILNEKKGISFSLAVRMHQILKIDAETLLNVRINTSGQRIEMSTPNIRETNPSYKKMRKVLGSGSTTKKPVAKRAARKK